MKQIKIAFAGQMRSGKDTGGEYVQKKYGGLVKKFAAPLYDILAYAQKRCRLPQSKDRRFLQYIGTEWGRDSINQNIWVDLLVEEVLDLGPSVNVAVTDARFVNEFEALKRAGFVLVKIDRSEQLRNAAEAGGITQPAAVHASEVDMLTYQGFDYCIANDGTLEELYAQIDQIIAERFGTTEEFCQQVQQEIAQKFGLSPEALTKPQSTRQEAEWISRGWHSDFDGAHPV